MTASPDTSKDTAAQTSSSPVPSGSRASQSRSSGIACEALIVGGGLVGLTLGLALARTGMETVVVDALDPARVVDASFDGRVSAIAFASCRMFKALDLWEDLAPHAQPINDILVTDGATGRPGRPSAASLLHLHFDHRELDTGPLGYLMENRHVRQAQQKALENCPGLTLLAPAACTEVDRREDGVVARLADGRVIHARVCLAADGRRSAMREKAGIKLVSWPYRQTGIVTTVAHEEPHHGVAQEYFLPGGPFAILPMTGNRSSLVWTEGTAAAQTYMDLDEASFVSEIRERFGPYLGHVEPVGPRWSYPLGFQIAGAFVAPRLALVGDAAHGIHPIAGQGFNLGLRDVAALSEVLTDARRIGLDPGAADVLDRYQKWRRFDSVALGLGTDALTHLFSNDQPLIRAARDMGLAMVNAIGPARRVFMRHAGGALALGGDQSLPRLLRGEAL